MWRDGRTGAKEVGERKIVGCMKRDERMGAKGQKNERGRCFLGEDGCGASNRHFLLL